MQDEPVYETVWNGGPGLTTFGAQRPGAVIQDVKEGDAAQWWELQQHVRTHPHAIPGIDTDSFPYITIYDTAYVPQPAYRWAIARLTAQWSRVLTYARYGGWPTCQLCGLAMPTYSGGGANGRAGKYRAHETPRHRAVCQTCFVRYRMARGRWRGSELMAARWAARPKLTAQARLEHRRASARKYTRARILTPDQLAHRKAQQKAYYHQRQAARQTPAAAAR